MGYIYLGFFVVFATIHLIASYKNNKSLRNVTKGFILFALMGYYVSFRKDFSYLAVLAIIFSFGGDMFLIPHGTKWFAIGGVSFMISHFFFALAYSETTTFEVVPILLIIGSAVIYTIAVSIIFKKLSAYLPKALFYPMFFYLLVNGMMNCFAIYRFASGICFETILAVIGAVSFFISDTSLFFVRFNKNSVQKSHFLVMLTYTIAEFLIVTSLILL